MGIELEASFGIAIGDKLDELKGVLEKGHAKPLFIPFIAGFTGSGAVRVGSPPTGKIWNLLTVTMLGADDHTSVTGTAAVYVDCDYNNLSTSMCRIPNLVIPSFTSISKGTLWAHSQGDVAVNFAGVAGGQEVVAVVTLAEYKETEVSERFL